MRIGELVRFLSAMDADGDVSVVLFKTDGTSEVFEIEEVGENDGNAQREIYHVTRNALLL